MRDAALLTPEREEFLWEAFNEELTTAYYLTAGSYKRIGGRWDLTQFADLVQHFAAIFPLRNATGNEANGFSPEGRPLNESELEYLAKREIPIQP